MSLHALIDKARMEQRKAGGIICFVSGIKSPAGEETADRVHALYGGPGRGCDLLAALIESPCGCWHLMGRTRHHVDDKLWTRGQDPSLDVKETVALVFPCEEIALRKERTVKPGDEERFKGYVLAVLSAATRKNGIGVVEHRCAATTIEALSEAIEALAGKVPGMRVGIARPAEGPP